MALLEDAKKLSAAMKLASKDPTKLQVAVAEADQLEKTETALVNSVNTYCGAP